MAWRRLKIEGQDYRWRVGRPRLRAPVSCAEDLILSVVVRGPEDWKLLTQFHGFAVEDVWDGRVQNLALGPALVSQLVTHARKHGVTRLDHAELLFPQAVLPKESDQEVLRAARRQWFRPEPVQESST